LGCPARSRQAGAIRSGQSLNATTIEIEAGHLSMLTHPEAVTELILEAARSTGA